MTLEAATEAATEAFVAGDIERGRSALREALAAPEARAPSAARARALYLLGRLAFRAGDQEESRRVNEEGLEVAAAAGDVRGRVDALVGLSRIAFRDGDYGRVRELAQEARELARTLDDPAAESAPLHMLAAGTRLAGDFDRARDLYAESLELFARRGNDGGVAMEHHNLGWVELHRGDVEAAAGHFAQVPPESDDAYGTAWRDINAAALAVARGRRDEAARLFAAGEATIAASEMVPDPDDAFELAWMRERLGPAGG